MSQVDVMVCKHCHCRHTCCNKGCTCKFWAASIVKHLLYTACFGMLTHASLKASSARWRALGFQPVSAQFVHHQVIVLVCSLVHVTHTRNANHDGPVYSLFQKTIVQPALRYLWCLPAGAYGCLLVAKLVGFPNVLQSP